MLTRGAAERVAVAAAVVVALWALVGWALS